MTARVPRGVWWAAALAVVVLAIAAFQAAGSSTSSSSSSDGADVIDPSLSQPTDPVNPLLHGPSDLVGQPVPSVDLVDFDGRPTSIAAYAGRPVVVNFWASTCVPCRTEMPDLEALHQQYGDRVAFVGVDTQESVAAGRPAAVSSGTTYDLISDPRARQIAAVGGTTLPTTVLVKADGTVARVKAGGAVDRDELANWIEQDLLS